MYVLRNDHLSIFWNARCACTSAKFWFCAIQGIPVPNGVSVHGAAGYDEDILSAMQSNTKKVLIVRDPVTRIGSIINHPIMSDLGIDGIDQLLDYLESNQWPIEHHLDPQAWLPAENRFITKEELTVDYTIQSDLCNVTAELDRITGNSKDIPRHNTSKRNDFTPAQEARIKKIYAEDYKLLF